MNRWRNWADEIALGLGALSEWQIETAALHWIHAYDRVRDDEEIGSPCFASAQNNAAVGHALMGDPAAAKAGLSEAFATWASIAERAAREEIDLARSSSSHHLRLAAQHSAQFAAHLRVGYQQHAKAGLAISRTNAQRLGLIEAAAADDLAVIADVFGPASFAGRLAQNPLELNPSALAIGFAEQAQRAAGYARTLHPQSSFWTRLETSVDMLVLMPSGLGHAARNTK